MDAAPAPSPQVVLCFRQRLWRGTQISKQPHESLLTRYIPVRAKPRPTVLGDGVNRPSIPKLEVDDDAHRESVAPEAVEIFG